MLSLAPFKEYIDGMTAEQLREYRRRMYHPRCRVSKVQGDPHGRWRVVPPPGFCRDGLWYAMSLPEAMGLAVRLHKERFA